MLRLNRFNKFVPLLLPFVAVLVFSNVLSAQLLRFWDDNRYVTENPYLRSLDLPNLWAMFTRFYFANYAPVVLLSFALDYRVWGLQPFGYHLTSLLLHGLNVALAYAVARRLLGSRTGALVAALVFAVHPLQVEAVVWVAGRKTLLCGSFALLALLCYMRSSKLDGSPKGRQLLVASWLLLGLALLCKASVVGMPAVFGVYDRLWMRHSWRRILQRNLVPLLLGGSVAALTVMAHAQAGGIKALRGGSVFVMGQIMLLVAWDYVGSFILPLNLNNLYLYDLAVLQDNWRIWLGLLPVLGVLLACCGAYRGRRLLRLGGVWMLVLMLPVANVLPLSPHRADRHVYLPLMVVGLWLGAWAARRAQPSKWRPVLAGMGGSLLIYWMVAAGSRSLAWQSDVVLWRDHLVDYPNSVTGNINLAAEYIALNKDELAAPLYKLLLKLDPTDVRPSYFLAQIAGRRGDVQAEIGYYRRAISVSASDAELRNNLGYALLGAGRAEEALIEFAAALAFKPRYGRALVNKGSAELMLGQYVHARDTFRAVQQLDADAPDAASGLCIALANLGDLKAALVQCEAAVNIAPENGLYLGRTAHVLVLQGNAVAALQIAQRAIAAQPQAALGYRTLGDAYRLLNEPVMAAGYYREALRLYPKNPEALQGLQLLEK
ncbi:MAG: hypothetical protein DWI62_02005 [Chloroflexi bacterium]|nr:MAG: hypothetical protein DWI62_02005 [Chloroflexota bacterium]